MKTLTIVVAVGAIAACRPTSSGPFRPEADRKSQASGGDTSTLTGSEIRSLFSDRTLTAVTGISSSEAFRADGSWSGQQNGTALVARYGSWHTSGDQLCIVAERRTLRDNSKELCRSVIRTENPDVFSMKPHWGNDTSDYRLVKMSS